MTLTSFSFVLLSTDQKNGKSKIIILEEYTKQEHDWSIVAAIM